jgi:hypothetical protein
MYPYIPGKSLEVITFEVKPANAYGIEGLGEQESAAMWKLYLKSDEGVAIRSTVDRFVHSFDGIR